MTITSKTPSPTTTIVTPGNRSGFQPIPTRIRDVREVPPLVVEPMRSDTSVAVAQGLSELGCKLAEVHRTAAEAWLSQGNYEQALPHLSAAATFAPSELEYHHQLGFVRYVTGDDAGAIDCFNTVLASDANNGEAWFNLGMVLFGQNQYGEAESCFGRAIDTNPGDSQTWNNRGVCLFKLDRAAEARSCFTRALQIDPNDPDARYNLGNIG